VPPDLPLLPATKSSLDPNDPYLQQLVRCKAWKLVNKTGLNELDVDDVIQEVWLDLIQRLPGFDPRRSQQRTFISRLVDHGLSDILRHRRAKRRDSRHCQSLNVPVGDGQENDRTDLLANDAHHGRTGRIHHPDEDQAYLVEDVAQVMAKMPESLQVLCRRLMEGQSQSAIARQLGVPRTTLQESVRKILRRFEDAGLRDYL
jgi:RNA polymerase sigma-70 factor, ECF subfamily